jgi:hypothetical protein
LLVYRTKLIVEGDGAEALESYEIDAALPRELREPGEQAAVEFGCWAEKTEAPGEPTMRVRARQILASLDSGDVTPVAGGKIKGDPVSAVPKILGPAR